MLLEQVAQSLGIESLARPKAFDATEFRLTEGIDRPTADKLAAAALSAGFTPRVRDRVGIRYSNQRSSAQWMFLAFAVFALFAVPSLRVLFAEALPVMLVLLVAGFTAFRMFRYSLFLPLAFPAATLDAVPERHAEDHPVAEAGAVANAALDRLAAALQTMDVPSVAAGDLTESLSAMRSQVSQGLREAARLEDRDPVGLAALQARMSAIEGRGDAAAERAAIEEAIAAEDAAVDAGQRRLAQLVADLLAVRRAASEALDALHSTTVERDAAANLRRDVAALQKAARDAARARGETR